MPKISKYLSENLSAALSVFFALGYVLVIVPKFLESAGMGYGSAFFAVAFASALGCFLSGIFVNKPLVFAPYLGENSFLAVSALAFAGVSLQLLLSAAFLASILAFVLFVLNSNYNLLVKTPSVLRAVLPSAVGLFLILTGFLKTGFLTFSQKTFSWGIANLFSKETLIVFSTLALLFVLKYFKVRHNVLISLALAVIAAFLMGLVEPFVYSVPVVKPIFFRPDLMGVLDLKYVPIIITFFVFLINDISVSAVSVLSYDSNARVSDEKKVMLVSSIASIFAPLLGCVSSGIYPESVLAIEQKGASRLSSFILGGLFLGSVFLIPFLNIIPIYICASILVYVGVLLFRQSNFSVINDFADGVSAFSLLVVIFATMNLAIAVCAFLVVYTILKLFTAKYRQLNFLTIFSSILSAVFLFFYPR